MIMLTSGEIPASVAGEGRPDGTGAVAYLPSFVVAIYNQYVLPKFKLNEIELPHRGVKTSEVYLVKRRDEMRKKLPS